MIYKTKPYKHQKEICDYIDNNNINHYALFWDMGAGKTKGAIDILRSKMNRENDYIKTLIICPISVMDNWPREIFIHSKIPKHKIQVIDGTTKKDGKKLKNPSLKLKMEQARNKNAEIFIINTESVNYQPEYITKLVNGVKKRVKQDYSNTLWNIILKEINFDCLILDEAHRFKTYNATRTKGLHQFTTNQNSLKYRYILTGTPILQNALDIWSQYYILDPSILGSNFFAFRSEYFYDANSGMPSQVHFPNWQPKDKTYYNRFKIPYVDNDNLLNSIIYKHANRVMKKDVLDLPPMVYQKIMVGMDKDQARIYKEMKNDLVAFLSKKDSSILSMVSSNIDIGETGILEICEADLAIVKLIRLQQIILGVFTNSSGKTSIIPTKRLKALDELLGELTSVYDNKIIVWCNSAALYSEISDICSNLKVKHTFLTGLQSKDQKQDNMDKFSNNPEYRILIANQAAGGTGCNLTAANYSVYYSRSFNLEHDLQSEARNYRGGQKRNVTRIDIVCPDTIDDKIILALDKKRALAENILSTKAKDFTKDELLSFI